MDITEATVRKVAKLASLDVTDDEAARLSQDMTRILGFVEQLDGLDFSALAPSHGRGRLPPGRRRHAAYARGPAGQRPPGRGRRLRGDPDLGRVMGPPDSH